MIIQVFTCLLYSGLLMVDFLDSPWFIVDGTDNGVIYFFSPAFLFWAAKRKPDKKLRTTFI